MRNAPSAASPPTSTPPPVSVPNSASVWPQDTAPVVTARESATRKSSRLVASLNRLSACTSACTRGGRDSRRPSAVTATGSVLASTAPSTNAVPTGSGVNATTTAPAATADTSTSPTASTVTGRHTTLRSRQASSSPAANSSGGSTTRLTISGVTSMLGTPGNNPTPMPATTSRDGAGTRSRRAKVATMVATMTRNKTVSTVRISRFPPTPEPECRPDFPARRRPQVTGEGGRPARGPHLGWNRRSRRLPPLSAAGAGPWAAAPRPCSAARRVLDRAHERGRPTRRRHGYAPRVESVQSESGARQEAGCVADRVRGCVGGGEGEHGGVLPAAREERDPDRQLASVPRRHGDVRVAGHRGRAGRLEFEAVVAVAVRGAPGRAVRRGHDRVQVVRGHRLVDRAAGQGRGGGALHQVLGIVGAGRGQRLLEQLLPEQAQLHRVLPVELHELGQRLRPPRAVRQGRRQGPGGLRGPRRRLGRGELLPVGQV